MMHPAGLSYLGFNMLLSVAALYLLRHYGALTFPKVAEDPLLSAIAAGFGAMVVLRSKLFTYRTDDGKDIPIGPEIVITVFSKLIDRRIDRYRSSLRQDLVYRTMKGITGFDNVASFLKVFLASFQNLSTEEKALVVTKCKELTERTDIPDQLKKPPAEAE
jgi:hypothetical protein